MTGIAVDAAKCVRCGEPVSHKRRIRLNVFWHVSSVDGQALNALVDRISSEHSRLGQEARFLQVLRQEILVESSVIVIIMAAGVQTGIECKIRMTRPILGDILMTVPAVIVGHGQPHT